MRKYSFRFLLRFCTIFLEDLSESISSSSFWHCVPFFCKNYQKVILPFLVSILYQFPRRSLRKYLFCFLLGLCRIIPEDLGESISFVSYWDWVPFLWKIYQKLYLLFVFDIVYHFSGRSARKCIFPFILGLWTISQEDLSETICSVSCWDFVPGFIF